jgi:hypothetical protein
VYIFFSSFIIFGDYYFIKFRFFFSFSVCCGSKNLGVSREPNRVSMAKLYINTRGSVFFSCQITELLLILANSISLLLTCFIFMYIIFRFNSTQSSKITCCPLPSSHFFLTAKSISIKFLFYLFHSVLFAFYILTK